jgi:hypothetical protein
MPKLQKKPKKNKNCSAPCALKKVNKNKILHFKTKNKCCFVGCNSAGAAGYFSFPKSELERNRWIKLSTKVTFIQKKHDSDSKKVRFVKK